MLGECGGGINGFDCQALLPKSNARATRVIKAFKRRGMEGRREGAQAHGGEKSGAG